MKFSFNFSTTSLLSKAISKLGITPLKLGGGVNGEGLTTSKIVLPSLLDFSKALANDGTLVSLCAKDTLK